MGLLAPASIVAPVASSWAERQREALDRQLLIAAQPPSHADAKRLLEAHKIRISSVVQVDRDSVLYLDDLKRPRTAWLQRDPGTVRVFAEAGFRAEPSADALLNLRSSADTSEPEGEQDPDEA